MTSRNLVLGGSLVLVCLLAFLTLRVAIRDGVTILVVAAFVLLGLLGIGVFGALTTPPEDE